MLHLTISTWKTRVWLQKRRGEKKGSQICALPVQREGRRAGQVTRCVGTEPLVTRSGPFSELFSIYNSLICFAGIFDHASLFIPQPLEMSKIALAGTLVGKQHHVAYLRE